MGNSHLSCLCTGRVTCDGDSGSESGSESGSDFSEPVSELDPESEPSSSELAHSKENPGMGGESAGSYPGDGESCQLDGECVNLHICMIIICIKCVCV